METAKLASMAADYARAWCSHRPSAVADCFAPDGQIAINGGESLKGRAALEAMAAGFYADVPDIVVRCEGVRAAGAHVVFLWTFEGHHVRTGKFVRVAGWEEWELTADLRIQASLGWYDAADYERQIEQGA